MAVHPHSPLYLHRVHRNTLTVFTAVELRIPFFLKVTLCQRTTYCGSVTFQKNGILSFTLPFKRPQIISSFLYETRYNNSQKLVNLTACPLYIYTPNGACLNTHPWYEQHVQHSQFTLDNTCNRKAKLTYRIISKKTAKFLHAGVVLTKVVASVHHHPTKTGTR